MGLETQAIVAEHLSVEEVCRRLRSVQGVGDAVPRPMHHPDYWIVEYTDREGTRMVIDLFLNSFAAEDYADLCQGPTTLLSTENRPDAVVLFQGVVSPSRGWVRAHEADKWREVLGNAVKTSG